ncbi:hypothetical protein [Deinococcus yunweiensis]|uniref:hypothetical protein n=1 Tax=Deinococcus yunweiensis TaxID=367282 RepID=UPI00398E4BC5
MTGGPQDPVTALLLEIRREQEAQRVSLTSIERVVKGDVDSGTPSVRTAMKDLKAELDNETDSLNDRVEAIENQLRDFQAYVRGLTTVAKWLGGASLGTLLLLIGQLSGLLGGGK